MNNRDLTPLRADGAEFYTLGQILLRGITAFRAYKNQTGWDIICLSNDCSKEWKVQVKYRTDYRRNNQGGGITFNTDSNDVLVYIDANSENADFNAYVIPKSDFPNVVTEANYLTSAVNTLTQYKDNWQVFDDINPTNQENLDFKKS